MLPLELPTLQNWSCHNCGGCCKQHAIELTREEFERIVKQNWRGQPGFEQGVPIFAWHAGAPWNPRYRLAHRSDGACVFLDDKGLCRIHSRFGEAAKPLACRLYPYVFHPAGKRVTVSLRYSCPSVVANRGTPVSKSQRDLLPLQELVVPEGIEQEPPPEITAGQRLEWRDFWQIVETLDHLWRATDVPVTTRLLRTVFVVRMLDQSRFDKIQGARLGELLGLLTAAAPQEVTSLLEMLDGDAHGGGPSNIGRLHFRLLVAQYARKDTAETLRAGWLGRWKLLQAAWRFSRGQGNIPPLQAVFQELPFTQLEARFGAWPEGVDELWTRYFRTKLQGLHFCGRAYYQIPLTEGYLSLTLIVPAVCWLARWLAASQNRTSWTLADFQQALAIADHHHGFSPVFGTYGFRSRVRTLTKLGDLEKLVLWYAR